MLKVVNEGLCGMWTSAGHYTAFLMMQQNGTRSLAEHCLMHDACPRSRASLLYLEAG